MRNVRDDERHKAICALYMDGHSLEFVGQQFGVTRERVRQVLVTNGIYERHDGFLSPQRVAARERRENAAGLRAIRKAKAEAKAHEARELYDAGKTYTEIASEMQTSISMIQKHIWKTGGPARNPNARQPKRHLSAAEKMEIAERWARGDAVNLIALDFKISANYVPNVGYQLGKRRVRNAFLQMEAGQQ